MKRKKKGLIHNANKATNCMNLTWNMEDLDEGNSKALKRTKRHVWLERNACLQVYQFLSQFHFLKFPQAFLLEFERKMFKFIRKDRNGWTEGD